MAVRMQQRRGTSEEWIISNPVLAAGEFGFETDSGYFKIGDGINTWDTLDYFTTEAGVAASLENYVLSADLGQPNGVATLDASGFVPAEQLNIDVTGDIEAAIAALVDLAPGTLDTLNELAAAIGDDADFITTINTSITDGDTATLTSAQQYTEDQIAAIPAVDLTGYATETYVNNAIDAIPAPDYTGLATETFVSDAIDAVVGLAPEALDTLSELATALGNDPAFITNISQDIIDAQAAAEATAAADATSKAQAAETAAKGYADTLAVNYDAVGSADDAEAAAKLYADGLAVNYDAAGSATTAETNAKSYADGLASNYDASGDADQALIDAKAYSDALIGDNTVDGTSGNTVSDRISTAVANLVDSAPGTLDTLNELAAALNDDASFATTVTDAIAAKPDNLTDLGDVSITSPASGSLLAYNSTTSTWENSVIIDGGDA